MKASADSAVTLHQLVITFQFPRQQMMKHTYPHGAPLSPKSSPAEHYLGPTVSRSTFPGEGGNDARVKRSTCRILEVTQNIPPRAYVFCLQFRQPLRPRAYSTGTTFPED